MGGVLTIATFTLREATRKKALVGAAILSFLLLGLYALGVFFIVRDFSQEGRQGPSFVLASVSGVLLAGLYVLNSIAGLLAIFSAVGSIAMEIDQGTLHSVVPRPISRWQILLGKWLGHAVVLVVYVGFFSLAIMAVVYVFCDFWPIGPFQGIGLMMISTLLLLSLTMAGSTFLPTMANGIIVFIVYSLATLGGMIEQLGWVFINQTMVNMGILSSLMMPTDAIWKMAAQNFQPSLPVSVLTNTIAGIFATLNPPSIWMAAYAVLYAILALVAAVLIFQKRDL